jgi:DNA-binding LacI/PurR family transcriptional regulator
VSITRERPSPVRQPTILDVAKRAGVSKSLVSLVMREAPNVSSASREAVLAAAADLGYRPNAAARSLAAQRSGVIGCVLSDLHNPFFADVIDGVEEEAATAGHRVLVGPGFLDGTREQVAVDTLLELRVDALILVGSMMRLTALSEGAASIPLVLIGHDRASDGLHSVCSDDVAGAEAVVDHLVGLGHRRIAHIRAAERAGGTARRRGYTRAMRRNGLDEHVQVVKGGFTSEGGARGMRRLLTADELPTAVFVANDLGAIGALDEIDAAGLRVPEDISVVGYDDLTWSAMKRISLTTVAQPRAELGRFAVRLVLPGDDESTTRPTRIVLPPRLVVRSTSGRPSPR